MLCTACPSKLSSNNLAHSTGSAHNVTYIGTIGPMVTAPAGSSLSASIVSATIAPVDVNLTNHPGSISRRVAGCFLETLHLNIYGESP
jgi:hypothetical protein